MFKENAIILFQGDSVTDCQRDRKDAAGLGHGYANLVATLLTQQGRKDITIYNRGISGNRVPDLLSRWQTDCLALEPDYISILIGINEVWRRYDSNNPTSDEEYERGYRELLEQTRQGTRAEILLLNPFLLDVNPEKAAMREDLVGKQAVVKKLAQEYGCRFLDLDALFQEACNKLPPETFAQDGVHPAPAGHALIAVHWLRAWETI